MNKQVDTLVILTPGFPESEADTTCLPLQQSLVLHLKKSYPSLDIIVLSFQYPYNKKNYSWFGVHVIPFNGHNKGSLSRLLLWRKVNKTLKKINKKNHIIGLLSFWYGECALIGNRFGKKHNIKHHCWLLGQDAKKENKYPIRLQAGADELVALSDFLQDEFEKNHGTRPVHLIPAGIDPELFSNPVKKKYIDILGAGSLIALKQYDIFLEMIAAVKKILPNIRSVLVGAGPEKEKLQLLISTYGLEENIILAGELPYKRVIEMMQQTKIFLHPSSYEGFSGVCLEALAGGAHVISFCRAMKEKTAHWHIVKDKETMKEKLLDLLQDETIQHDLVLPFLIGDTATGFGRLFKLPGAVE